MAFKDLILATLTGAAEQIEEVSIEAGLQSVHDKEPDVWARIVDDMQFASNKLAGHIKGKFPAAMIEGLGIAAKQSQEANPAPPAAGEGTETPAE